MDFKKTHIIWTEKEIKDSWKMAEKIPGFMPQKIVRTRRNFRLFSAGAAILLALFIKDMIEDWPTYDTGNHIWQIILLFIFLFFFLFCIYMGFFREKHALHTVLQKNKESLLRPRSYALKDYLFTENDGTNRIDTSLTEQCCIYFSKEFVTCVEQTEGIRVTRWNMPRRIFDNAQDEQSFREACGRYCSVKDL